MLKNSKRGINPKLKIIIICAHLRWDRSDIPDKDFLQPSAGLQIASQIDRDLYDVTLYHEMQSGPFKSNLAGNYDLVFLTGIQKDFDRMRQLSFFFRSEGVVVCAGGSICTLYPDFAENFFDVICIGGIDSVSLIMKDYEKGTLKSRYESPPGQISDYNIDYSLLKKNRISMSSHLIESSRGCNYGCGFCSLKKEKAVHSVYSINSVIKSINSALSSAPFFSIRKWFPTIMFIDNHFSHNKEHMRRVCSYLKKKRFLAGWSAMVTRDFLSDTEVITEMYKSRCKMLFSGIESLDKDFLKKNSKNQNLYHKSDLFEDIDKLHKTGILLMYGYLFDPRIAKVEDMIREVNFLVESDTLIFASFFSFISPLLGTEVFNESAKKNELLPNLRLRDLDGTTLAYNNSLEDFDVITDFSRDLFYNTERIVNLRKIIFKTFNFIKKYKIFNLPTIYVLYRNNFRPFHQGKNGPGALTRNYIGGIDRLDPQYYNYPENITSGDWEKYFKPVYVTDSNGRPLKWISGYGEEDSGVFAQINAAVSYE
jgi:radical SAM superfamily enzyme YgiQ (UPF0313 family)